MFSPLHSRTYRHLFAAQVVALLGTGLATVALGLIAFDLAGAEVGTALAIKMVAYVIVAPVAGAFANRLPRRPMLVALDLMRAAVALCLPFVDAVWQVYALIFVLQAASAAFTPTFQATIPDVLPDEAEYTRALSLSQLAYNLENLVSPALAAALLAVISFHWLFAGTALGFLVSAALVVSVLLPTPASAEQRGGIRDRTTRGIRLFFATPRLRGLLALNMGVVRDTCLCRARHKHVLLARLGLRAGEVAALEFDDLDWRAGQLRLRAGKCRRERVLPLPQEVGAALVEYLQHVRPLLTERRVFLTLTSPVGALHSAAVTRIVQRSLKRAGIPLGRLTGAHMLRHTAASRMVNGGASFKDVADVLGHRSLQTTGIYAKLDLDTLAGVALPWIGGGR